MKLLRVGLMALTIVVATGCADKSTSPNSPVPPPPPPPPGSAVVSLATPNADDGAIVVSIHGPGLTTLASASSDYVFYSRLAGAQDARVILVGNVAAGPIFTFKLAAGSAVSAYTVTIDQVANRGDVLRASTMNYSLTITAAP